jgi:transcriptional regulator with XRE-family HTH domain
MRDRFEIKEVAMEKDFGKFLRKLREDRGLTLRQVEETAKISNAYLSQVERGKRRVPHFRVLQRLAGAYGVPISTLVEAAESEMKGEPVEENEAAPDVQFVSRGYEKLSEEKRQELKRFLKYLTKEEKGKRR